MLAFWVTSETLYKSAMLCGVEFHLNCAFLFTHRLIEFIKRSTPASEELLWVKVFHPYSIRTIADGFISFHKNTHKIASFTFSSRARWSRWKVLASVCQETKPISRLVEVNFDFVCNLGEDVFGTYGADGMFFTCFRLRWCAWGRRMEWWEA